MNTAGTAGHEEAVNRRRRLGILYDALGGVSGPWTEMDTDTFIEKALSFADRPGNSVDMVCWDCALGNKALYPSGVLPPSDHPAARRWRHEGTDFLEKLVAASRARGLECFWSHRIAEVDTGPGGLEMERPDEVKAKHPDWLIRTWWWQGLWNLAVPAVREHKTRIIRELAERYDFDGFVIDFARHVPILPVGRQWELRDNVTDLMRRLREALDTAAARRGHPVLLGARVGPDLDACRDDGLDIAAWSRQGQVDFLILGSRSMEADIAGVRDSTGDRVKLYPCFDFHHSSHAYELPSPEILRGLAGNWWHQGADGIVGFNFWPFHGLIGDPAEAPDPVLAAQERQNEAFLRLGDPDYLRGKSRTIPVERRGGYIWHEGSLNANAHAQLPALLAYDGRPSEIVLYCGVEIETLNNLDRDAALGVVLSKGWYGVPHTQETPVPDDRIETRMNGILLENPGRDFEWKDPQILFPEPEGNAGSLFRRKVNPEQRLLKLAYPVAGSLLRPGRNIVGVSLAHQAPHILRQYRIEKVELHLPCSD